MLKLLKISTVLCSNFNIARGRHSPNLTDADLWLNQFSYADELQTTAASRFQGLIDILLIFSGQTCGCFVRLPKYKHLNERKL